MNSPENIIPSNLRRTAVIVFCDIVGYSALSREREPSVVERILQDQHNFVIHACANLGGRIVKGTGDGYMIEFPTAGDAVKFAMEFQLFLREHRATKDRSSEFHVRIGIHAGEVLVKDGDLYGDAVNIASRIEGQAEPDGIMVSAAIHDMMRASTVRFSAVKHREIKGVTGKMPIYAVELSGATASRFFESGVAKNSIHLLKSRGDSLTLLAGLVGLCGVLLTLSLMTMSDRLTYLFASSFIDQPKFVSLQGGWEARVIAPESEQTDWAKYSSVFPGSPGQTVVVRRAFAVDEIPVDPAFILGKVYGRHEISLNGSWIGLGLGEDSYTLVRTNKDRLRIGENVIEIVIHVDVKGYAIGQASASSIGLGSAGFMEKAMSRHLFLFRDSRTMLLIPSLLLGLLLLGLFYVTNARVSAYLALFVLSGALLSLYASEAFVARGFNNNMNWIVRLLALIMPLGSLINIGESFRSQKSRSRWEIHVNQFALLLLCFSLFALVAPLSWNGAVIETVMYLVTAAIGLIWTARFAIVRSSVKARSDGRVMGSLVVLMATVFWCAMLIGRGLPRGMVPEYLVSVLFSLAFWVPFFTGCTMVTVGIFYYRQIKLERDALELRESFLRMVADISQSKDGYDAKISRIHAVICKALNVDRSTLYLSSDYRSDRLQRYKMFAGLSKSLDVPDTISASVGLVGYCWSTGRPVLVSDMASDPRFQTLKRHSSYRTASCIAIPLIHESHPIGVLTLADPMDRAIFSDKEFALGQALAKDLIPFLVSARAAVVSAA